MPIHSKKRLCLRVNVNILVPHDYFADNLVAEQWLLLHPSIPNFSISNVFEPVDNNETYSKIFLSNKLINRSFCRFHDSPHLNQIQVDLWGRINQSVDQLLNFRNLFRADKYLRHSALTCLDKMSLAMNTRRIFVEGGASTDDKHMEVSCIGNLPPYLRCI